MSEPLYPHQREVIAKAAAGEPVYVAHDPGLGKSRTALEGARSRGAMSILIVAPSSGRYVWERECRKWYPNAIFQIVRGPGDLGMLRPVRDTHPRIVLVTYGLLSQKDSPYASVIAKRSRAFDMTIIDEAAALKNSAANRTKAILKKMWPQLGYVLPMSGTPAPNHAGELFPILQAHYPKAIEDITGKALSEHQFQDAFCRVVNKRFGGGRDIRVIEGSANMPELRRRMNGYMIRVRKEDVLKDLPPLRWDVVPVQPKSDLISMMPSAPEGLDDDGLLKWLSGATGDEHVMRLRRMLGIAKLDASIEYLQDFLGSIPWNRKILVFAHHKEVIAKLVEGLQDSKPASVTGATSPLERAQNIDMFLTDTNCRVFVGNIQAAGTGLTLVGPTCECSDVFFVEATYSPADNHQAACRVHRIGQSDAVVVRMLTARGTIDDRIADILARKSTDFEQLFG